MTDRELMQDALDALNNFDKGNHGMRWQVPIIKALRARLAQPEPAECDGGQCGIGGYCKQCPKTQPDVPETAFGEIKPVAWKMKGVPAFATSRPNDTDSIKWDALYTAPPQREWVGLREGEYEAMAEQYVTNCYFDTLKYAKAIEAKLKEKNNG
jgi:hypothetical protein